MVGWVGEDHVCRERPQGELNGGLGWKGHEYQGSEQEAVEEAHGMQVWGCQQFGCELVVGRGGGGDRDNEDSGNFAVFFPPWRLSQTQGK